MEALFEKKKIDPSKTTNRNSKNVLKNLGEFSFKSKLDVATESSKVMMAKTPIQNSEKNLKISKKNLASIDPSGKHSRNLESYLQA